MIQELVRQIQASIEDKDLLRKALGDVSVYLNNASTVFKNGNRQPSSKNVDAAKSILYDIDNGGFDQLLNVLTGIDKVGMDKNILNLIHTLIRKQFNNQQIESLRKMASNYFANQSGFREETDKEGLDQHLKSSVYNLKSPKDKTIRVVREVLQNAVDATDPQKHTHLSSNPEFRPEILITTNKVDPDLMDIIIEDKGIGMNWDTLSKKFFVTFQSGKNDDVNAAGGFGIAKALIQDTPEHGWSIDTNDLHTSRFHKNVYFGTNTNQNYEAPRSEIKKTGDGVTLSLFGVPFVNSYEIKDLCSVYGINGRVEIILDGVRITPKFTLNGSDVKVLDASNLFILSSVVADKSGEDTANSILEKSKIGIGEKLTDVSDASGGLTSVKFYLRKVESYGKLYVMVNGQYQFQKENYIQKMDIICAITTKARPSTDEYPLDPGRAYVREPLGSRIDRVVESVKEFSGKVVESDVIKEGLDFSVVNQDSSPMNTVDSTSTTKVDRMAQSIMINLNGTVSQQDSQQDREAVIRRAFENIDGLIKDEETIKAVVSDLVSKNNFDVTDVKKALEGLTTTGAIIVQKNYVAREWIDRNTNVAAEMMIIWQRTLKILVDKLLASGRYSNKIKNKEFIPGIIFSSECLGLYLPANEDLGRRYPTVCINPMLLAACSNPKLFYSKVNGQEDFSDIVKNEDNGDEDESSVNSLTQADTPTNRLAKSFFHIGTHELCHLLFPDYYGYDEFHNNITFIEIVCHDCIEQIKQEMRPMMKKLRANANRMINQIGKIKKNESWIRENFNEFLRKKTSFKEASSKEVIKCEVIKYNTFKKWFYK